MTDSTTHFVIEATFDILILFSVLTWTIIFFKLWQFTSNNKNNATFNEAFWNVQNLEQAKRLPDEIFKGTQSHLAYEGLFWLDEYQRLRGKSFKYAGNPNELLEHGLRGQLQKEQHALEGGLTVLASIGSTAPFVGLFGTVMGIMHAMHDITASGSTSLDVVAGPIGDALVATAIGIAVAVPAVLAYNYFLRRVKSQRQQLESFVGHFLLVADLPKE
ncbi:MAG: MotA/TolQ/ExbB proton channel family protein [Methylococcales bacterium]|nr:MotA/TolQ/ExbB proton channel family protein [Methylococcales bacterium]